MSSFGSFHAPLTELARASSFCESTQDSDERLCEPRSFVLAFLAVVACGTFNNLTFCVISGASQDLVKKFNMQSQVAVLTMSMTLAALITSAVSTKCLIRFRYYTRVRMVLLMTALAYAGVALASSLEGVAGFALTVVFSVIAGSAQVMGEITNLSFLKVFPPELIGGWGAGTGIAGVAGGGIYILLSGPLGLSNPEIFVLMIPTALLYWCAFHYLHRQAISGMEGFDLAKALGGTRSGAREGNAGGSSEQLNPNGSGAAPASWANVKIAFRCSGLIMFSLAAVYLLEYTIYPGLDDRETLCSGKAWFSAMWMCYNVGVTMSRLSVAFFRIERVWLLTLFQLLNVIGWVVEVSTGRIRSLLPNEGGLYIMAGWMVLVGLCGGATYGNCMYLFNCKEGIPGNIRELGINLGFLMSNIGIAAATLSFSWLDKTVLAKDVLYPNGC